MYGNLATDYSDYTDLNCFQQLIKYSLNMHVAK